MRENTDQYNSEYGHFSCSVMLSPEHEMSAPVVPCTEKKKFFHGVNNQHGKALIKWLWIHQSN